MKKNIILPLSIIIVITFIFILIQNSTKNVQNQNNTNTNEQISTDFTGKPTLIVIAGTYCPHCQKFVPRIKSAIFDKYKKDINVFINVIDGENGKRFNVTDIKQGYKQKLSYDSLTNTHCGYVPSWVLLDKNGIALTWSCGGEKGIEYIDKAVRSLIK